MTKKRRTESQIKKNVGPLAIFIREQRKKLGYSQKDFSLRTGVGLRFLKELELGKKSLRLDKVNLVLNFLGFEVGPISLKDRRDDT